MKNNKLPKQDHKDIFAEIAAKGGSVRKAELVETMPDVLPCVFLPLNKHVAKYKFNPCPKINSQAELERELEKYRVSHEKYLRDFAPPLHKTRIKSSIKKFDWRTESEVDKKDFQRVLDGKGDWETVTIPHYGGPLGRAVTFYRTTFMVTERMLSRGALFACFKGVDYKSHIFINGAYIGSHEGFFAPFDLDFTEVVRLGENVLLVKVENDAICLSNDSWGDEGQLYEGDKLYAATGPGYDDPQIGWHHCPPGMGIYQDVFIEARPRLFISDIFVRPLPEQGSAEAWIDVYSCELLRKGIAIELSLYGQNFQQMIFQNRPYEVKDAGPGVNYYRLPIEIKSARKWDIDSPWLYQIHVKLLGSDGKLCDTAARQFGMRSFVMDEKNSPHGRFYLNGRQIRLRGANTMGFEQQCVMKKDFKQLRDDLLLAKICNMNFLRLTQRPVQPEVYDLCDKLGLMTQTDLPLFGVLRRNQFCEAVRQAGEMERLVRNYPCNIIISYINEPLPNAWEKPHRHLTRSELEAFFVAADAAVRLANPDRVIKPVDGDYDPPSPSLPDNHCYCGWYNGHGVDLGKLHKGYWQKVKPGWMYGCGEFGAEGLDNLNVMRNYYPKSWLPANSKDELNWTPGRIVQAQTGRYHYLWFDTQHSVADWIHVSQRHQAWVVKLMTEAFRRNSAINSIAIHLFIDAFPAGWMKAIMDCRRQPKPAFFKYRDALMPLMTNLRSDRQKFCTGEEVEVEAWVCNDLCQVPKGMWLHYQLEDENGKVVLINRIKAQIAACESKFQGFVKFIAPATGTRKKMSIRLGLVDSDGKVIHDSSMPIEVFSANKIVVEQTALILGDRNGTAALLANQVGCKKQFIMPEEHLSLILIDNFEKYDAARKSVNRLVNEGAIAIFLELPHGEYRIGDDKVKIDLCGMNARHFVSRATGHPLVEGFEPEDFKCWFDPKVGYITPILETTFVAEGFDAILSSGNGGWQNDWSPSLAVAEKKYGKGCFRISQIMLAGRTSTNPPALLFAKKLLTV